MCLQCGNTIHFVNANMFYFILFNNIKATHRNNIEHVKRAYSTYIRKSITCSDIFKTFVSSVRLERQLRTLHSVILFIVYSRLRYNTRDERSQRIIRATLHLTVVPDRWPITIIIIIIIVTILQDNMKGIFKYVALYCC